MSHTARRGCPGRRSRTSSRTVTALCEVVPLTAGIQAQARVLAARTGYTIYDAQILAAAAEAGCACVWSEDFQDGHQLSGLGLALVVRNPFAAGGSP